MHSVQNKISIGFRLIPRLIIRWAFGCTLLMLLAGCVLAVAPVSSPVSIDRTRQGVTTLVLWHGWSVADRQVLNRLVARFNEQHADSRVIVQVVPLATFDSDVRGQMMAGGGPHLMLIPNSWIGSLVQAGALLPLDDWQSAAERRQLLPATLAGAQSRGGDGAEHVYGLPISFDTIALYYNSENVLTPPANTADLISIAHGLGDPRATPPRWGLAYNLALDTTIGYLFAAGGRIFDEQGKVVLGTTGRAGTERWLNWLLQLSSDEHQFARAGSSIEFDHQLTSSSAIMTVDWAHQFTFYRSLWGTRLRVAPLPRLSETGELPQPYVRSDVLAINGRIGAGEHRVAMAFARFLVSEAAQRELLRNNIQPARQDLRIDQGDLDQLQSGAAQVFRQVAQQGIALPNGPAPQRDRVRRELEQMLQQVLLHTVSPADAVTEADQRLHETIRSGNP